MTLSTDGPRMNRAIFGLSENDLPHDGIDGTAVWPVIESSRARNSARAITGVRRHLAWYAMKRHAGSIDKLVLINPPRWAKRSIDRRRSADGLPAASTELTRPDPVA
ncbi:MAG: hypothetical protein GY708_01840 [Actinomycetia bacterium]|nr:hypothetical protein [Actinomycetes bacterium]MCP4960986.1 hypothetical protein [Actinomycetes bacterium]